MEDSAMLKVLPKPEGHDLRNARAEKSESARDWLPEDALYEASKQIAEKGAMGAVVVAWYERSTDGLPVVKYCLSQSEPRQGIALMADTQFEMQCAARDRQ
jgi:hypothetical protein